MNTPKRAYSMQTRAAQAEATKTRIRQAAADLHAERLWQGFTLDEVARRAGVTVQTVLRIYGSKQALNRLASEAAAARERAASAPGDIPGAVRALYEDYERIGDQVIQLLADEPRDPEGPDMDLGRMSHRKWNEAVFAPFLAPRDGAARERLLTQLIVATDVYVWKLLRRDFHLGRAEAETLVVRMISAVIQGEEHVEDRLGVLGRRRQSDAEPGDRASAAGARP